MTERHPAGEPARSFCSQCGARLPDGARFCPGCGRALDAERKKGGVAAGRSAEPVARGTSVHGGASAPPRTLRDQLPGLVVLALFLAAGTSIWVGVLRPPASAPGAPTRPAAPPAAGELPPDHPPLALPEEGKKFIAELAAKAAAAPADAGAWRTLAQVQARAAEIDPSYASGAIESYRRVLALAPDDADATRGLGNVYYDRQDYAAAAEQYEKYLARQPDDASVRTDLATAYLYQRQIDRAIAVYGEVIATHPDFLQAHFNLGLAYEAKGERGKALASLDTAHRLAADDTTRGQIERVTAQLKGEGQPRVTAPADSGRGEASAAGGAGRAPGAPPAPAAKDFRGAVAAGLRAHPILGPKISGIEWTDTTHVRVLVHDFPMQAMPESVRGLFRGRLETILDDAKTGHGVTGETALDIVDAASGAGMERVTR